jgi:Fe-S-cluster-containing dehydrogenase component
VSATSQLAFVLDQRKCIGCHACTVACKVEHGVELGVFRTWVKYVEESTFPDSRRHSRDDYGQHEEEVTVEGAPRHAAPSAPSPRSPSTGRICR